MPCVRADLALGSALPTPAAPADGTMVGVSDEPAGVMVAGQIVDLAVGEAVHGGWCIAKPDVQDAAPRRPGRSQPVVFVRHALPGERVRARVTQTTTRFARADAVEIIRAAPERVPAPCPYAAPDGCGGCDWQHASLPAQRAIKSAVISQQLRRIAGLERTVTVQPLPGDEGGLGWRTRVRFAVGADGRAGLFRHRSHKVVPVSDCLIAHPLVREAAVTGASWPGARWVEVAVAPDTGQRAVLVRGSGAATRAAGLVRGSGAATPAGGRDLGRPGPRYLTQRATGRDWRVAAAGFWQVHPAAADVLASAVADALRPEPGETALDLFCGAGLFAGILADRVGPAGAVVAIERDAAAVRDARHNLRRAPWARVHEGDAARVLGRIGLCRASVAVLDPPRTGADRALIEELCGGGDSPGEGALRTIAYVSCDPATLARDIAVFGRHGWRLDTLRGYDAFPMTHHVECVATLVRPAG